MKKIILLLIAEITAINLAFSQCQPYIRIDGIKVSANETAPNAIKLPLWLNSSNSIAVDTLVSSISVIEFTENGSALEYSGVLSITSTAPQSPPSGKVWKVESIVKPASLSNTNGAVYTGAGTYTLTLPACVSYVCIEAWGAGAGGGGANNGGSSYIGGGGGGGGYGHGCYTLSGQTLSITVGAAGISGLGMSTNGTNGGSSTVTGGGVNISVEGGYGGLGHSNGATGGAGGSVITGTTVAVAGSKGVDGNAGGGTGGCAGGSPSSLGGRGGSAGTSNPVAAGIPGGGGGGTVYLGSYIMGGAAAPGQVKILW